MEELTVLEVKPDNIPDELKQGRCWIVWRYGEKRSNGKPPKPPYNPRTGQLASHSDPLTWATFEEAFLSYKSGTYDGIGRCVTPDENIVYIDIDDCIKEGVIHSDVKKLIEHFNSYTETSPSETGIHIIAKGTIPKAYKVKKIEVYNHSRYLTFTGHIINNASVNHCQKQIDELINYLDTYRGKETQQEPTSEAPVDLDDKYKKLWDGDLSNHHNDRSRGLLALCQGLIQAGYDTEEKLKELIQKSSAYNLNNGKSENNKQRQLVSEIIPTALRTNYDKRKPSKPKNVLELWNVKFQKKKYSVPGIIPQGLSVAAGVSKVGKTELFVNAAIQAALGEPIFHSLPPGEPQKVLYYFLEGGITDAVDKVKCLHPEESLKFENLQFRTFDNGNWRPMFGGGLVDIEQWFQENKDHPKWVIIDTYGAFQAGHGYNGRTNIYIKEYSDMRKLFDLAHTYRSAITIVTHAKKGGAEDVIQSVINSTAIPGGADSILVLKRLRNTGKATLQVMGRNGIVEKLLELEGQIKQATVERQDGDKEEVSAVDWTLLGKIDEADSTTSSDSNELKVLTIIPQEETDVASIIKEAEKLGFKDSYVRRILSKLKKMNLIESPKRGKYKRK